MNLTTDTFTNDNVYLNPEMARKEVMERLAALELDRHRLRLQMAMNGMDGEMKLQGGMTINEAIQTVNERIRTVEDLFSSFLEIVPAAE